MGCGAITTYSHQLTDKNDVFKLNLSVAKNVYASTGKTSRNVDAKMTFRSLIGIKGFWGKVVR